MKEAATAAGMGSNLNAPAYRPCSTYRCRPGRGSGASEAEACPLPHHMHIGNNRQSAGLGPVQGLALLINTACKCWPRYAMHKPPLSGSLPWLRGLPSPCLAHHGTHVQQETGAGPGLVQGLALPPHHSMQMLASMPCTNNPISGSFAACAVQAQWRSIAGKL